MSAKRPKTWLNFLRFSLLSAVAGMLTVAIMAPAVAVAGVVATQGVGMFESLPDYIRPVNASQS